MKKIFTLLFLSAFALTINAQNNDFTIKADPNAGVFKFESETIDYGQIAPDSDRNRSFKFTNTGKAPIIISRVKPSCGCTVPSKPNRPIMPGESAEIGVNFTTKSPGKFSKTITVTSNASVRTIRLVVKGEVVKASNNLEKPKSILSAQ